MFHISCILKAIIADLFRNLWSTILLLEKVAAVELLKLQTVCSWSLIMWWRYYNEGFILDKDATVLFLFIFLSGLKKLASYRLSLSESQIDIHP